MLTSAITLVYLINQNSVFIYVVSRWQDSTSEHLPFLLKHFYLICNPRQCFINGQYHITNHFCFVQREDSQQLTGLWPLLSTCLSHGQPTPWRALETGSPSWLNWDSVTSSWHHGAGLYPSTLNKSQDSPLYSWNNIKNHSHPFLCLLAVGHGTTHRPSAKHGELQPSLLHVLIIIFYFDMVLVRITPMFTLQFSTTYQKKPFNSIHFGVFQAHLLSKLSGEFSSVCSCRCWITESLRLKKPLRPSSPTINLSPSYRYVKKNEVVDTTIHQGCSFDSKDLGCRGPSVHTRNSGLPLLQYLLTILQRTSLWKRRQTHPLGERLKKKKKKDVKEH